VRPRLRHSEAARRGFVGAAIVACAAFGSACGLLPDEHLVPLARTCGQWEKLAEEDQLTTAEALVADRIEAARRSQQLPETATRAEIVQAVNGSIYKVCLIERRPGLPLENVIAELYG
jgi:hypothetical protein